MNDFEQLISNLAKESGLPFAIDNKNSVTLEYDDIFITRVSQIKNLSKSRSTLGLMLFKNLY
jgi:hypothetical protein